MWRRIPGSWQHSSTASIAKLTTQTAVQPWSIKHHSIYCLLTRGRQVVGLFTLLSLLKRPAQFALQRGWGRHPPYICSSDGRPVVARSPNFTLHHHTAGWPLRQDDTTGVAPLCHTNTLALTAGHRSSSLPHNKRQPPQAYNVHGKSSPAQ
jgi:hypothetical protein